MNPFTETQRLFDSTFNKIIVLLVTVLLGKIIYNNITEGFKIISLVSITILFISICLFILFKVKTEISEEGIQIKIIPFNVYNKKINWSDIKKVNVIEYSAMKEYGGWGYRRSKNGIAINPSGNKGIKIFFKNGTNLLIGTRQPDEVNLFLKSIKK